MGHSLRITKAILWIVLLIILCALIGPAFYNRPMADDMNTLAYWRTKESEIHSVLDVGKAIFDRVYDFWANTTGTFSVVFFYAVIWYIFRGLLSQILPIVTLVLLVLSCFQAVRCIKVVRKDVSSDTLTCLALLLAIMYLLFIPNACEGIYWVAGASYTLAFSVTICAFSSLFCKCWKGTKFSALQGVYLFLMSTLFFMIGGGDHLNSTFSLVLYGFFALWMLGTRKPKRFLIPFLFLAAGYLLAVTAPGNTARQQVINQQQLSIPLAFISAFIKSLQFVFSDVRYFVFLLLFIPFVWQLAPARSVKLPRFMPLWTAAGSWALLASLFFPLILINVAFAPRHTNRFFLTLCPLLLVNLYVLILSIKQRFAANGVDVQELPLPSTSRGRIAAAVLTVGMVILLCVPNIQFSPLRLNCKVPVVKAVSNLVDGQLRRYAEGYDSVAEKLAQHPGERVIVNVNPSNFLLGSLDISVHEDWWKNIDFAGYYGGENSILRYEEP